MSAACLQTELRLRPHEDPIVAQHRGLCIHEIRMYWRGLHGNYWDRKHARLSVKLQVAQLRSLGPGPVEMPERVGGGILGAPIDWWGPKP